MRYGKGDDSDRRRARAGPVADYLDPYGYVHKGKLLDNLRAIMQLKRDRPEDVVLLLGNHDLHYFCEEACVGTRFDMEIAADASKLFLDNIHLFQYAFQYGEYLFTHAGVSQEWFDNDFCGDAARPIADQLNNPAADQVPALLRVGSARDSGQIKASWRSLCTASPR